MDIFKGLFAGPKSEKIETDEYDIDRALEKMAGDAEVSEAVEYFLKASTWDTNAKNEYQIALIELLAERGISLKEALPPSYLVNKEPSEAEAVSQFAQAFSKQEEQASGIEED